MSKNILTSVVALVAVICICTASFAHEFRRAKDLEDARGAVCRVCVPGARGSGFFFGVEGDYGLIGTNYHVVQKNRNARLDFWTNGVMESVNATIDWRAYNYALLYDFAIMRVPVEDLARINPCWIALAGADAKPNIGAIIISCGAPDGRFPQAWKGQLTEYYNGKTAVFSPPPVPGQSGSPICEYIDDELFVTGVLTWLFGEKGRDESKGGAIPIANLYKALGMKGADVEYHDEDASPVPPDATECADTDDSALTTAAKAPCILEFTQNNCPPCVEAERDVEFLRALGVPVYVYDVATAMGSEYVKRYGVERTPTFVVLGPDFRLVYTYVGAGKGEEIRAKYEEQLNILRSNFEKTKAEQASKGGETPNAVLSGSSTASPDRVVSPPRDVAGDGMRFRAEGGGDAPVGRLPEANATQGDAGAALSSPINLPEVAPLDFRARPPVYESARNVGVFDEADARWQKLKRKRNKDEQPKDDDQSTKEDKTRPRLKERLQDGTSEIINKAVNETVEKFKAQAREKWEAVKYRVFFGLCLVLALATVVASAIIRGVKAGLRWILKLFIDTFGDDLDDEETQ